MSLGRHHHLRVGNAAGGRRGTLLILVLVVALGLVAITLYFSNTMLLEYRAADNSQCGAEAVQASDGARRYLKYYLANLETPGQAPDPTTTVYPVEAVPVGDAKYWLIGRDPNAVQDTGVPTFGLIDEGSKLNINNTSVTLEMLEMLPNMTEDIASAIIDWRDADDEITGDYGAESETYMMSSPPYYTKNAPFESPEELRLVAGVDCTLLYGEDTNRNGILDPNENDGSISYPEDNQDGILDRGWIDYITVWSREPNTDSEGSQRINIAGNDPQSLQQAITDVLGESKATEVINAVRNQLPQMTSLLQFYLASGLSQDEFLQIEDKLTVGTDKIATGKVNVNTAPRAVLECIPGIGTENVEAIISYRQGKTAQDLASISWVAGVLDEASAIQAGRFLTTRTYVYSADVVALGHMGRGLRRDLYVIDTAEGTPRVVYRRDLSRTGWPFGAGTRLEIEAMWSEDAFGMNTGLNGMLGMGSRSTMMR